MYTIQLLIWLSTVLNTILYERSQKSVPLCSMRLTPTKECIGIQIYSLILSFLWPTEVSAPKRIQEAIGKQLEVSSREGNFDPGESPKLSKGASLVCAEYFAMEFRIWQSWTLWIPYHPFPNLPFPRPHRVYCCPSITLIPRILFLPALLVKKKGKIHCFVHP